MSSRPVKSRVGARLAGGRDRGAAFVGSGPGSDCTRVGVGAGKAAMDDQRQPSFAAAPLRYAAGGTVWLGFAADPDVALKEVLDQFPWPDRVRVYRAARSLDELKALQQTIEALRSELASHGVTMSWLGVDEDAHVVSVMVPPATVQRAARKLRRFGDAVRVKGGSFRSLDGTHAIRAG
jgi:hypothetical protein